MDAHLSSHHRDTIEKIFRLQRAPTSNGVKSCRYLVRYLETTTEERKANSRWR